MHDQFQVDEFMELIKASGLEGDILQSNNNVTVFVPSNDAVEDFRHDMEQVIIYLHCGIDCSQKKSNVLLQKYKFELY